MSKALHVTEGLGLGAKILMPGTLVTDPAEIAAIEKQYSRNHNLYVEIDVRDEVIPATQPQTEEH